MKIEPSKSKILDINSNHMAVIAFFGAWVLGMIPGLNCVSFLLPLIIYLVDQENKFVAFNALQAFLFSVITALLNLVAFFIGCAGAFGSLGAYHMMGYGGGFASFAFVGSFAVVILAVDVVFLVFYIIAAVKAANYEIKKLPFVGNYCYKKVFGADAGTTESEQK